MYHFLSVKLKLLLLPLLLLILSLCNYTRLIAESPYSQAIKIVQSQTNDSILKSLVKEVTEFSSGSPSDVLDRKLTNYLTKNPKNAYANILYVHNFAHTSINTVWTVCCNKHHVRSNINWRTRKLFGCPSIWSISCNVISGWIIFHSERKQSLNNK